MRITRLYLRNDRVYENELDLELPGGLVGIFGVNGSGKSAMLESVLWTLWGKARTSKELIRTSGVNGECVTEVEFEHEGHLYLVRRRITGVNHTVKAEAFVDNGQVAASPTDVKKYVHSVLGMDDAAFRASVFAEQKQLAAFSNIQRPEDRRKLVLRLLGITPLDDARDNARRDAKAARDDVERVRALLLDVDELREIEERLNAAVVVAEAEEVSEATALATARTAADAAEAAFVALDQVRAEYDALVAEGKQVRAESDAAAEQVSRLEAELAALAGVESRLAELQPIAARREDLETRFRLVESYTGAVRALGRLPEPEASLAPPDDEVLDEVRARAAAAVAALNEVRGRMAGAHDAVERARAEAAKAADLSGGADCPTCGQALGEAFEQVQAHRHAEVAEAEERLAALTASADELAVAAETLATELKKAQAEHKRRREAWDEAAKLRERRAVGEAAVAEALAALGDGGEPEAGELERLREAVTAAATAEREALDLGGQLRRRPVAEAAIEEQRSRLDTFQGRLTTLREKVKALDFEPTRLVEARTARDDARTKAERAAGALEQARLAMAKAKAEAAAAAERRADAEKQHEALQERAEESRHLGRVSELISSFRTTVVATVGPRLSAQAADLFAELTDREYDQLQVDPETYEIQIVDQGRAYGMDRFSGSETDLANLALRVAISEQVRFQSGGAVGLLVLDEVFGPLDDDRKERMLLGLERLRSRFRQVLVVTHDPEIKEQLPTAIEVVKLGPRRATARIIASA